MNPIAISLGPLEIRWYAILILSGFVIGMYLIKKEAKRLDLEPNKIMDLCFYLILVSIIGARKEGMKSLFIWACVCLTAMLLGPVGTGIMPKAVFGLFERFSTFSAVTFNAVLGTFLLLGKFGE